MTNLPTTLIICFGIFLSWAAPVGAQTASGSPHYVGSETCGDCHGDIADAWSGSHHAAAWMLPGADTVLGDFDDAEFSQNGVTTQFRKRGEHYYIETDGPTGARREYRVHSVAGLAPLQQYLVATEPGRLQALDIAWDTERRRWYHLYPDQDLKAGDGLHWTGPYKSWNARCADCHATGYEKNYSPRPRTYASTQAEIGVGCEACHGPGEAHTAWAGAPGDFDANQWSGVSELGLTLKFEPEKPQAEIQQCAGCHSRREPFGDGNPAPGTPFHDAYRLALLRDGLYHADGSIDDEVYVYGSFLQSKMHAKGVRCTDCHEPHAATLRAEANAVCTRCHSPAGDERFASLRKTDYDDPSHHFHEPGTDGARCKSCHMIERVYMGIDGRRDHSFRIPRPDLSDETGAPNACTDCHRDRDPAWAADAISRRYPDTAADARGAHFSQAFAAARNNSSTSSEPLLSIAENAALPGIVRASALDLLRGRNDPSVAERTATLIGDHDPLVRAAAVALQRGAPAPQRVRRLIPAFEDPVRLVRIAAARAFLGSPVARLPRQTGDAVNNAMAEWRATLTAKADYPETQMAIGGTALVLRNPRAAEQAFREAVALDPQSVQAWTMIARIKAATGDRDGAATAIEAALRANPTNPMLEAMRLELGP